MHHTCQLAVADCAIYHKSQAKIDCCLVLPAGPPLTIWCFGQVCQIIATLATCYLTIHHYSDYYPSRSFPSPCKSDLTKRPETASAALASLSWCHVAMDHLSGRLLLLSLSSLQFRPFRDFAKDSPSSSLTLAQDSRLKIECSQISGHHYSLLCLTANCGVLSPFRLPETAISDISFTTSYASLAGLNANRGQRIS